MASFRFRPHYQVLRPDAEIHLAERTHVRERIQLPADLFKRRLRARRAPPALALRRLNPRPPQPFAPQSSAPAFLRPARFVEHPQAQGPVVHVPDPQPQPPQLEPHARRDEHVFLQVGVEHLDHLQVPAVDGVPAPPLLYAVPNPDTWPHELVKQGELLELRERRHAEWPPREPP